MSTKTFNISMPEELVKELDRQSKLQGSNRSDFIRQAVRRQITLFRQWQDLSIAARSQYSGPRLSESEVSDIVSRSRKAQ